MWPTVEVILFYSVQWCIFLCILHIQGSYYKKKIEILKHSKPSMNDLCQLQETMKTLTEATNLLNGSRHKTEESPYSSGFSQIQKD